MVEYWNIELQQKLLFKKSGLRILEKCPLHSPFVFKPNTIPQDQNQALI